MSYDLDAAYCSAFIVEANDSPRGLFHPNLASALALGSCSSLVQSRRARLPLPPVAVNVSSVWYRTYCTHAFMLLHNLRDLC